MTVDTHSPVAEETIESFDPAVPDVPEEHISLTDDAGEELDVTGYRLLVTIHRLTTVLDAVRDGLDRRIVDHSEVIGSGYVADLEAAFQVGASLLDDPGAEALKRRGADALDHEDRVAVRANLVPVAEHVNVDLTAADLEVSEP